MADTYLNVVDGDDHIVGRQLRSIIHKDGLRHREVHVWFVTPKGMLIVQRRSKTKDTYPGLLDATVGGHVEEGQDYKTAALTEIKEETGLTIRSDMLVPLAKIDATQIDAMRGVRNVVFRMIYLYRFAGEVQDLTVEAGDGAGFELVSIADMLMQKGAKVSEMIPGLFEQAYQPAWQALRDTLRLT